MKKLMPGERESREQEDTLLDININCVYVIV